MALSLGAATGAAEGHRQQSFRRSTPATLALGTLLGASSVPPRCTATAGPISASRGFCQGESRFLSGPAVRTKSPTHPDGFPDSRGNRNSRPGWHGTGRPHPGYDRLVGSNGIWSNATSGGQVERAVPGHSALSVLDTSPIVSGSTARTALRN